MSCKNSEESVNNIRQQPVPTMLSDNLIGVGRLAEYLDVSIKSVRHWVYTRQIPFIKVGRHIRFRFRPDILNWLEQRSKGCP